MSPMKNVLTISQDSFESLVKENMEDLDMDPEEALEDAIQTLTLQGVDLSGIIKRIPGVSSLQDDPIIQLLEDLKCISSKLVYYGSDKKESPLGNIDQSVTVTNESVDLGEIVHLLNKINALCTSEESNNVAIATRNGGVELCCRICYCLHIGHEGALVSTLRTMKSFLQDLQSKESFRKNDGPKIVLEKLFSCDHNVNILDTGFQVVAVASAGSELVKESFMDLKIDSLLIEIIKGPTKGRITGVYESICALVTPDDNRVLASQVYGYARKFAKLGIVADLVKALHDGITSPSLVPASCALKAVAVNDEICRSIAEEGGIDVILHCIDDSVLKHNVVVARACCSLLSKLAGSDSNKSIIVLKGGLNKLITLSSEFSGDPSVLQEIMCIIGVLSLRSPENASLAIEAGAGEFVIQAMQKFPTVSQLQRQGCLMIRNLAVRNLENRSILLGNGIEKIIRRAKQSHENCRVAASDALRDLGLDNYNL